MLAESAVSGRTSEGIQILTHPGGLRFLLLKWHLSPPNDIQIAADRLAPRNRLERLLWRLLDAIFGKVR